LGGEYKDLEPSQRGREKRCETCGDVDSKAHATISISTADAA